MDPVSVGMFIASAIVFVLLWFEVRYLKRAVATINELLQEVAAKVVTPDARVTALELENRTIKADITEIKAIRRTEVERARQAQSRPASFKAFRNQIKGTEIEP